MTAVMTEFLKPARRFVAFAACLCIFCVVLAVGAVAAPVVEEATNANLSIALNRERIQWGEELEITVSVANTTGMALSGGIYVSFDDEVLVLDVRGGKVLRPGTSAFNLATSTSKPI